MQGGDVEAVAVVVAAAGVGDGDDPRPGVGQQPRGDAAHLPEALHRDAQPVQRVAAAFGDLLGREEDAAAGGLVAALAAADLHRLAGHDGGHRVAVAHRVGVHHPGHDAGVGAHVGGGDVAVGADDRLEFGDEAAAQVLQFAVAQRGRVDDDAALGAAVGQVDDGALPGHPHGEGAHLVEGHGGGVADAALVRAAGVVVLHAVAREGAHAAVVHLDGEVHGELAARPAQRFPQAAVQAQDVRRRVELLHARSRRG